MVGHAGLTPLHPSLFHPINRRLGSRQPFSGFRANMQKKARHDETGRRVGMVLRKDHQSE